MSFKALLKKQETHWRAFWLAPMDAVSMDLFRIATGISLFAYLGSWWMHAPEWLSTRGFHPSSQAVQAARGIPALPPLPAEALPWFGMLLFGALTALTLGWRARAAAALTAFLLGWIILIDSFSAFTLSKLSFFALVLLAACPGQPRRFGFTWGTIPAWPVRMVQLTLVLQYAAAGWQKAFLGNWLEHTDVLWTHVQGDYRNALAAWLVRHLPFWAWTVMQQASLVFELAAPLLFFSKRLRPVALVFGLLFQGLVALLMHRLIFFSLQMLSFYAVFAPQPLLDRLKRVRARFCGSAEPVS